MDVKDLGSSSSGFAVNLSALLSLRSSGQTVRSVSCLKSWRWRSRCESEGSASFCFLCLLLRLSFFLFPFTLFSTSFFVFLSLSLWSHIFLGFFCYPKLLHVLVLSHNFFCYSLFILLQLITVCMICSFHYHVSLPFTLRTTSETSTTAVHNHTNCEL